MAEVLTATINANLTWTQTNASLLSLPVDNSGLQFALNFATGTGPNQVNLLWYAQRTLAASAIDNLDLNGVLLDAFGQAVNFSAVRALLILNLGVTGTPQVPTSGQSLTVGGAASNGIASVFNGSTTAKAIIQSGGFIMLGAPLDGYGITPSTADILCVTNAGTLSVDYAIAVIGS